MTWPTVVLILGVLLIIVAGAALSWLLQSRESAFRGGAEARLSKLEDEFHKLQKAIAQGIQPAIRKAGF